jgi:drug/metabolite transporter (DMT)-like permease
VDIVLALVAAVLFAVGTVLLQKAGMDEPAGGSDSGLLLRMARRPVWLAGIAADGLGFVAQAAALSIGRLAVVQPLLISSVVFALPLGARFTGQRIRVADVAAAALVVGALVAFLVVADPSGGRDDAPFEEWLVAGAVVGGITAPLVLVGRRLAPAPKAALFGIATGLMFALSAALTKAAADRLGEGVLELLLDWRLYALLVIGYISMTLNQIALATGALAPAIATSMAFDPIGSVVLGTTLLQESLHETAAGVAAIAISLAAALAGMFILARGQAATRTSVPDQAP